MIKTNFLIIGSGFTSSILAQEFSRTNQSFEILEVFENFEIKFEVSPDSIFQPAVALKTKRLHGGIPVWGNSVTIPSNLNFFSRGCEIWKKIGDELEKISLYELIPGLTIDSNEPPQRIKNRLTRILPGIAKQMCVERHGYAVGPSSRISFLNPIKDIHFGLVQDIFLEGINKDRLYLLTGNGEEIIFEFSNLIFASGTIGNALLVSRVTGARDFSIGNHASSTIGQFEFRKPQNLSAIQQAFHLREREFLTFSHFSSKWQVQSAIRIIPNRKKRIAHEISIWFRNIFKVKLLNFNLWKFVYIIVDIIRRIFGFGRLEHSYKLRILAEVPISSQGMHVTAFDTNSALIKIDMCYTAEAQEEAKELLTRFTNCASSSKLYSDVKITADNLNDMQWEDSGHYFGTVPIAEEWKTPSVDGNLKLRGTKSIWVIGNSAHPVGSHGHPTALSILLAKRLAEHLVDKDLEQ